MRQQILDMIRTSLNRIVGACALALATSCGSDSSTQPLVSVSLLVSTQGVVLSETAITTSFFLTTSATGGRLQWQVAHTPAWLTVTPSSGTITDKPQQVTVSAPQLVTMEPATLSDYVEFVSNGGTGKVTVTAVISPNPVPQLSPATVAVPSTSDSVSVLLTNAGRGTLTWSITSNVTSATLTPSSGSLTTGRQTTITVKVDKGPMLVGTTFGSLTIKSNARSGDVLVPLTVAVAATPRADLSTARLVYASGVSTRAFYLRNTGKGPLNWSSSTQASWMTVSPTSGQVPAGDSSLVTVSVNRNSVPANTDVNSSLSITSDAINGTVSVGVLVTSATGFPLGLTVLDHNVIDAEYSQPAGLIVTVSANPSQLNVLEVETGRMSHVALSLVPTCVAIRADGLFAAVGHDGYISYVDLSSRSVVRTYAVTTTVLDVVLPQNGWVYAFPLRDQWESIRNIELATGVETRSGQIYAGMRARLHPSGKYIYGAWNGLSPTNVDKFDITIGVAKALWGSPYWGDHDFGGLEWFSEDGTRMFARSGEVFTSSDSKSQDMYYSGSLAGTGYSTWVADSRAKGRVYAFSASATLGASLRVYDGKYLALLGTTPLPSFTTGSGQKQGLGYYVFPGSSGDRIYTLIKAPDGSGLTNYWGIAVLDGTAMP